MLRRASWLWRRCLRGRRLLCYRRAARGVRRFFATGPATQAGVGAGSAVGRPRRYDGTTEPRLVSARRTGTGRDFIETATISLRFAVIGAGRLGASLALALRSRGATLLSFTARSSAGRARAEAWLGSRAVADVAAVAASGADLYIIAVPDQALPDVSESLGAALAETGGCPRPVVLHTSGATSVTVLRPCEEAGAATLVFHPLQTFSEPVTGSTRFAGAAVAITPSKPPGDGPAARLGFAVARALGARPFLLPDDKRGLYHAAATFACNYLVTLEYHAEQLFVSAGLPADEALELFLPLVRATVENIADHGPVGALTGPLSRGDARTVAGHLQALAKDAPHLLPLYRALGSATLALIEARGGLDSTSMAALAALLEIETLPPRSRGPGRGREAKRIMDVYPKEDP